MPSKPFIRLPDRGKSFNQCFYTGENGKGIFKMKKFIVLTTNNFMTRAGQPVTISRFHVVNASNKAVAAKRAFKEEKRFSWPSDLVKVEHVETLTAKKIEAVREGFKTIPSITAAEIRIKDILLAILFNLRSSGIIPTLFNSAPII